MTSVTGKEARGSAMSNVGGISSSADAARGHERNLFQQRMTTFELGLLFALLGKIFNHMFGDRTIQAHYRCLSLDLCLDNHWGGWRKLTLPDE